MIEAHLTIVNQLGLHMRAAGKLAKVAGRFHSRIHLLRDGIAVDGKSIVGILTLAAAQGSTLTLRADGEDEHDAVKAIEELVSSRFGEDQ